jgi:hypothetical protein
MGRSGGGEVADDDAHPPVVVIERRLRLDDGLTALRQG